MIVIDASRGDAGIQMCPITLHILPGITHLGTDAKNRKGLVDS